MTDYDYYLNVLGWKQSLGEDFSTIHLRNGHEHAKFDPKTKQLVNRHYDEIDPNKSLTDLVKHMWQSDVGKAALGIGTLIVVGVGITVSKSK